MGKVSFKCIAPRPPNSTALIYKAFFESTEKVSFIEKSNAIIIFFFRIAFTTCRASTSNLKMNREGLKRI